MSGIAQPSPAALEDAVAAVRPLGTDPDIASVFAAAAWTSLVEPGDGTAGALVGSFGPADALDSLRRDAPPSRHPDLRQAFDRWRPRVDDHAFLLALRNAAHLGARLIVPTDRDWPAGLDDLGVHAPLALWALSPSVPLPRFERSVALVGSRSSTDYGQRVTTEMSCGLADRGFAIVSGGAAGIDGIAHRGALVSGGSTVAVLAGGLDRLYPAANVDLLHRIAREGVVLAEMPCGARPMAARFLKRNRLIAALSRVTVVVEAASRSGAANTAAHAAQLGRPLGAVPGSVYSGLSAGTHTILRETDAVLVRNAADVAELARDRDAAVVLDGLEHIDVLQPDPIEQRVLEVLCARPRTALDLAARAGLSVADTAGALSMLTLLGGARERDGGWSLP